MSILDALEPFYRVLPEVKVPEVQPPLKKKILWSAIALILFFIMGNITVLGLEASTAGKLEQLQVILASEIGTLITVGIGPIVLASIILQLLVGGGLLKIDLTEPKDKARFTGLQKLLAVILCFVEAGVYVFSGLLLPVASSPLIPGISILGFLTFNFLVVVLQVALGSIILLYLDEVVSKYGIGSGIGLFIAGGVAGSVFWRFLNPLNLSGEIAIFGQGTSAAAGLLWQFFSNIPSQGFFISFVNNMLPFVFAIIVFLVVVFAEGIHANIPLTVGRGGFKSRFPVKFLYVSNIPVILAVALFANIQLWAAIAANVPFIGLFPQKLSRVVIAPFGFVETLITQGISPLVLEQIIQSIATLQFIGLGGEIVHAVLYISILTSTCIVFGKFWVEMAGQGPEAVANQLQKSGMFIPGFRRDPRIVRKVLDRYIPPITILGAAFVGLLAGFADLTGALGSGTGILLTVGIVYRLYEELARAQLMELHPMLGRLFG